MKKTAAFLIILASVFGFDILTKFLTVGVHAPGLPGIISIYSNSDALNTGGAWNIGAGTAWFGIMAAILAIAISIAGVVFFIRSKNKTALLTIGLALFIAGALGNAFDRLISGGVHDFLRFDFINFPIFNVADIAICFGAVLVGVKFAFR